MRKGLEPIEVIEAAYARLRRMRGAFRLTLDPPGLSAPIKQTFSHGGRGELMTDGAAIFGGVTGVPVRDKAWYFSLGRVFYVDGAGASQAGIYGRMSVMPDEVGMLDHHRPHPRREQVNFILSAHRTDLAKIVLEKQALVLAGHPGANGILTTSGTPRVLRAAINGLAEYGPTRRVRGDAYRYEYNSLAATVLKRAIIQMADAAVERAYTHPLGG